MHKSEFKANPTLINYVNMTYELRVRTTRTYRSTNFLKFNAKVDSIFH